MNAYEVKVGLQHKHIDHDTLTIWCKNKKEAVEIALADRANLEPWIISVKKLDIEHPYR